MGSQAKFGALILGAAPLQFLERNFMCKIGKLAQSANTPEAHWPLYHSWKLYLFNYFILNGFYFENTED